MRCRLVAHLCHVGVYLRVALGALEILTALLGDLLILGALPLWKPSLWIGLGSRVLWVETLRVLHLASALLGDENLGSSCCLMHIRLLQLLLLLASRHGLLN